MLELLIGILLYLAGGLVYVGLNERLGRISTADGTFAFYLAFWFFLFLGDLREAGDAFAERLRNGGRHG